MPLVEEAQKAARLLLDHAYVRILARAEPDALCAAALIAHALRREGIDFHVSTVDRLDASAVARLAPERPDLLVLIGLSGDAATREPAAGRRILLDNGEPTFQADARAHDDAALASLAHMVAAGISRRNADLAPLALAGALADLRHVHGPSGLDAEILREALDDAVVVREPSLALQGPTLAQALAQLDAPFVAGLTGRARNARKMATDLALPAEAPPGSLSADDARRVADVLTLRLLQQEAPDAALDLLLRPAMRGLKGPHTGLEIGELARAAEAACAAGRPGLAFAALWPDDSAGGERVDVLGAFREETVAALLRAERDARREGDLLVVESPRPSLCRPLADRVAASSAPEGTLVVAHATDDAGAHLAIRAFARPGHAASDAAALARSAVAPLDAQVGGHARAARLLAPEATRAIKALADALARGAA